ncbi:MAG TPA: alkaline phosphatase family protein [Bryobacteraceae bacterium]|jgi:arylsulfatase A-like enzyme|nr:alkaline phosphatase family protein [Bryobacteraceae bacterium]
MKRLGLLFLLPSLSLTAATPPERPALTSVLVIDGLRPDSITPEIMPHLDRLKNTGVWYAHSHSVFPTVTRVNTASISTGTLPSRHGIVSNQLYLPTVSNKLLNDADYQSLLSLAKLNDGRVVGPKTLGEFFKEAGIHYVALSSGSTGNALLLNSTAPFGGGEVINSGFENGDRVAFPDSLNSTLLARFGKEKGDSGNPSLLWTERVLREYVLDTMHPQVIIDWMDQPDSVQHQKGVGSPEALEALRLVDQQIGLLQDKLRQSGLDGRTDIIVTCDHGFDYEPASDLLNQTGDVVVDNEGGTTLLYVKDHAAGKIEELVTKLQANESVNAIFVAAAKPENSTFRCAPKAEKGFVPGTFALDLASQCLPSHGPDVIVTWHWDDAKNAFGVPGTQAILGRPGTSHNGHGSLNPYTTHTVLIATGKDFPQGKTIEVPSGNVDLAPTLLAIEGLPAPASMQGRQLTGRQPKSSTRRIQTKTGQYCSELEISYAGDHAYLDQATRCR